MTWVRNLVDIGDEARRSKPALWLGHSEYASFCCWDAYARTGVNS